ncbi:DNA adenine methylase [Psychromonas ingrahamii 37]|uniref:Site-specific DNA-methyltransferase (adenine-specific) n=1 Tax=Psychromonas ingrahamii (strain DSM 17664 / CCUG 51855 / 37) TaxID=357804 RepID=A1SRB9_PSYIN|nr:Dam family site-specific DNA-(adenine-N6)-methyltransferase [Psychromonas ingrahamii]ABM02034.1 DNA adenine methylase [Psychromonas ingrahamii 37]
MTKKNRAFLKWAGGKFTLTEQINQRLPEGRRLIEPFVGAGSVFLNSNFDEYLLNDINPDLIEMYKIVKRKPKQFICDAKYYFQDAFNNEAIYYQLRSEFNNCKDVYKRSLLFLYLNRFGYNGLCRYNKSGGFNVPFGRYKKPYFPEKELLIFSEKSKKATFTCKPYQKLFQYLRDDDVLYCDPPYVALSKSASFTSYASDGFSLDDQANLAKLARESKCSVLVSNHDTILTQELYRDAFCDKIQVSRTISSKSSTRQPVGELFALFDAQLSTRVK